MTIEFTGDDVSGARDVSGITGDIIGQNTGNIRHGYNFGSITRGLVAYYPLDEGSGTTVNDQTELGQDGTISGATYNGSGQVGSDSLDFDGQDDFCDLGQLDSLLGQTEITVAMWIYFKSGGNTGNPGIFNYGDSFSNAIYINDTVGDNAFDYRVSEGGAFASVVSSSYPPTDTWVHHTMVFKDSTIKAYQDGSSIGTDTGPSQTPPSLTNPAYLGRNEFDGNRYADVILDDVRLYDRALSEPEIDVLVNLTETSTVTLEDTLQ